MRFKRTFTDPAPEEREKSFAKAGIDTFHGVARFTGPTQLQVGEVLMEGRQVLVAAGAKPQKLNIRGEQYLTTSEQFLELDSLPRRIVFVGGGYTSRWVRWRGLAFIRCCIWSGYRYAPF